MKNVLSYFTDQFSGPGRAIGYYRFVMCVTVCAAISLSYELNDL